MNAGDDQGRAGRRAGRPDYKLYKSRPGLLGRLRSPDLSSLRDRARPRGRPSGRRPADPAPKRRWLRWIVIAVGAWLLLSFVAFAISAQIQRSKLADGATTKLGGSPLLLASPQTILLLGSDRRDESTSEPTFDPNAPSRADTIMLLRIGGGSFRKLSIPRDSFASIPGHDPQKINAAYALDDDGTSDQGNTSLMVETVEGFLGVDIDHVVLVDFEGFKDFIDAIGGVEVDVPDKLCSEISGGKTNGGFTKRIGPGEETLDGEDALTFARTRTNSCPDKGGSDAFDNYDDLDRAAAQQEVLSGIKGRLTSPLRLPINFIKGPIIGWTAPQAIISDMGALTMPQLVLAAAIGGDSDPALLEPAGPGPLGSLIIPAEECQRAVEKFLGGDPPRTPECSPG